MAETHNNACESRWGSGPEESPYSADDLHLLEQIYTAYCASYPNRDNRTELELMFMCRARLRQEKCLLAGEIKEAGSLESIINSKESALIQRRKNEPQPGEHFIDDIVSVVERNGWETMSCDRLLEALAKLVTDTRYDVTLDAAEQMLLAIYNTCAWNENRPESPALPPSMRLKDPYGQFRPEPDDIEEQIYADLKLSRE